MNIEQDIKTYMNGLMNGHWQTCLSIETRYGLDGYPPEVVTTYLAAERDEPGSGPKAIDDYMGL